MHSPNAYSQPAPAVLSGALSPAIEWKDIFWPTEDMVGNSLNQDDSSQDWFYDLIEYKKNGVVAGYVAVGFSMDTDFDSFTMLDSSPNGSALNCYGQISGPPSCDEDFGQGVLTFGFARQIVVFYALDGSVDAFYRYNMGELWGVLQDDNEDIYLFGQGNNPRNLTEAEEFEAANETALGSVQIHYNPTTSAQPVFPLSCISNEPFNLKFNVVKIATNGDVIWNNYYGLAQTLADAQPLRGLAHTGVIKGNTLLAGGMSQAAFGGNRKKMLVSIDKTTGFKNWGKDFYPSSDGEIFDITTKNNQYLISGIDYPNPTTTVISQGFVSMVTDVPNTLLESAFNSQTFYHVPGDIPAAIDPNSEINTSDRGRSTSAIFTSTNLYWFIVANKIWTGGANAIADGVVIKMDLSGNIIGMDNFGEIRAFDLWVSGTPTDDGGFALVTTRHTPTFYDTGTLPYLTTPLDLNNPGGATIDDCIACDLSDPNLRFWELMSSCSYVRKYNSNFNLEWDKIWDSSDNAPRVCFPGNFKQQECVYNIIQSSTDGGLLLCGNTSDNLDDSYLVKLANDCGLSDFYGKPTGPEYIVDYSDGIYDITTNTTWSSPKKVLGTVRVKPGFTLTIQNTTVEFATGTTISSGIDVEQNGYLIVDGSTLTSGGDCDDFWEGISVLGNSSEHQYYDNAINGYHQGRIKVKNGSIIEYATTAITNGRYGFSSTYGGIVQIENSTFQNCNRAIQFLNYQNFSPSSSTYNRPDRSYIKRTDFNVTDAMPLDFTASAPLSQITLWRTDRVKIEGCNFTNTATASQSEYRGKAIYSENANYLVREHCNDPGPPSINGCQDETRSTFTGWHKAIEATSSIGRAIQVRNSDFHANMIGIVLKNDVNGTEIYNNHFYLGDHPFSNYDASFFSGDRHLGIYTTETHLFTIEDNEFKRATGATEDAHGVLIHNSKGYSNEIYRNTFENLKVAANGWQVNRNANTVKSYPAGALGLQFLCNTNQGNEIDFKMSRDDDGTFPGGISHVQSGMRGNQGDDTPSKGANDTFSAANSDPNIYTHWTIDTDQSVFFRYNYHSNPPLSSEITPGKMILNPTTTDNGCLSNYGTGAVGNPSGKMLSAINELGGIEYTYSQLIDNGNTQNMLSDIALTWPNDAWDLRDELIARSPYNSEEVLIAAAKKEIMPHAMLLEVLLANPDVIALGRIIYVVQQELANPLPQYMVDMLYLARDEKTLRTSMENSINHWHAKASRYQKAALSAKSFGLSDTVEPDSTLWILSRLKTPQSDLARAYATADQGDYTQAVALIDSVNMYKLMPSQVQNLTELKSLFTFFDQLNVEGKHLPDLDNADLTTLIGFAENGYGTAAQKAQNALCFHYGICYDREGNPKANQNTKPNQAYIDEGATLSHFNTADAFPNPAMSFTTIDYSLLSAKEETNLNVYNSVGQHVLTIQLGKVYQGQEVIDTRQQPNGFYVYEITQDGNQVANGKFIVNR